MYLKLGNTNLKYNTTRGNFMVIGEVVQAMMGYESPVLVRTIDELETWFGNNFEEKEWLEELLKRDSSLSLFLSSPISQTPRPLPETEGWINLSEYEIIEQGETIYEDGSTSKYYFYSEDMFPTEGVEGKIYRKRLDPLGELWEDYIWTGNSYTPVRELPQNLDPEVSISFLQRDTLRLGWKNGREDEWGYCYPGALEIQDIESPTQPEIMGWNWEKINLEKLDSEKETLAFSINFPENFSIPSSDNEFKYILLGNIVYYVGFNIGISDQYYTEAKQINSLEELKKALENSGWIVEDNVIWKPEPTKVTYCFNWSGEENKTILEPNFKKNQELISTQLTPVINFWSRTIGRPREDEWEEDNIHIKIEPVYIDKSTTPTRWRVTITRYDYMEVHEGTLTPSDSRIDWVIERDSKLVHAEIPDYLSVSLKELPTGNYQLRGAEALSWGKQDLQYTLEWMLGGEKNYFPDYILIPDPEEWMNESTAPIIYKKWVDLATTGSFQFLIQNSEENVRWNITSDKENRLVWFWQGMEVNGDQRPGYYLYLTGLLDDTYSMTSQILLYNLPTLDPYNDSPNSLIKLLEERKSNYLMWNNQMYYYKEYQNGEGYETTGWMRFVMGKITRELHKNMGEYIGKKSVGEVMESIRGIMKSITDRFSIIRDISITEYDVNFPSQKISLTIQTQVSDLRDNNMTLDININYNKN